MEPVESAEDLFDFEEISDFDEEVFDNDDLEEKGSSNEDEPFYRRLSDY